MKTEMKVIQSGNSYTPITKDAIIHDFFPPALYKIHFNQMTGYDIQQEVDFEPITEKIYGNSEYRINKMFNAFNHYESNMGIMLSGPKGIGKSLFIRLSVLEALSKNLPVFIIDRYMPGLPNFLGKIKQECLIIIDEFEKKFDSNQQAELLSFLDGMNTDKKLFIISLNELRRMNEYMINRPGRFHYHYKFSNPSGLEVEEYLKDNLVKSQELIPIIIKFAQKTSLNYDSLQAIVFELNIGSSLEEAIQDLNIAKSGEETYRVVIKTEKYGDITITDDFNLFDDVISIYHYNGPTGYRCTFSSTALDVETISDTEFLIKGLFTTYEDDDEGDAEVKVEFEANAIATKVVKTSNYHLDMFK